MNQKSEGDAVAPLSQPQKFSRYRSVRRATAKDTGSEPESVPALPTTTPIAEASVRRIPSRYHRNAQKPVQYPSPPLPASAATQSPSPPIAYATFDTHQATTASNGPAHEVNIAYHDNVAFPNSGRQGYFQDKETLNCGPSQSPHKAERRAWKHESRSSRDGRASRDDPRPQSYEAAREEARMILEGEYDRLQQLKATQEVEAQRRRRLAAAGSSGDRRADAPLISGANNRPIVIGEPCYAPQTKPSRSDTLQTMGSPLDTAKQNEPFESAHSMQQAIRDEHASSSHHKMHIQNKFDAPVSAVNAGERRVRIKCNEVSITLPITPSTTAHDLLNSASKIMSQSIDPRSSIVVEAFSQLGLERSLRRYEHVRDVMNSWDYDDQNHFTILPESEVSASELTELPHRRPSRTTVHIYHSQKPDKWDKRWVCLQEDGQVTVAKSAIGSDTTNICHISDFDVYMPTRRQLKKMKPPKKICFAVKSQQKPAVFLNSANFVHFFSSNDKDVADQWYRAVQSWRSWYLVAVMGEGRKTLIARTNTVGSVERSGITQPKAPVPYQLGSFKPLLTFGAGRDAKPSQESSRSERSFPKPLLDMGIGRKSVDSGPDSPRVPERKGSVPPSSFPKNLITNISEPVQGLASPDSDQGFTGTGLLARSASKRSQGGKRSGHGVHGEPGKPLIHIEPTSEFTDGSLLRQIEAWNVAHGGGGPKIDRVKRMETTISVGEGF